MYMDEAGFRGIIDATIIAHVDQWSKSSHNVEQPKISQFVVRYPRDIPDDAARGIVETECSLLSERLGCLVSAECLNFDNSCMITIGKTRKVECCTQDPGTGLMQRYNDGRYPPVAGYTPQRYISNRKI